MSHSTSRYNPHRLTRRDALKSMAAAGASLLLPRTGWTQEPAATASQPMRLAFVGVGGQGFGAVENLIDHRYVAFADVDERQAAKAYEMSPKVPRYQDFRHMLDKHGREIDAVIISTPDHSHFPIAMGCMAAGKHVYIEKPLAPTPWECRELQKAAGRYRVKTQLGIQGHSSSSLRMLREWIDARVAGEIRSLYLWTDRMQPYRYHWSTQLAPEEPIPSGVNWDLWLAGRPRRPFSQQYVPNRWRNWWDLGTGPIGDIGVHMFDVVEFALGLGYPEWVEAETPDISPFTAPPWTRARWHYAARAGRPEVDLYWSNGTRDGAQLKHAEIPRIPADVMANLTNGIAFVGTEGTILIEDMRATARPRLYPLEREREVLSAPPARRLPRVVGGHFEDLFRAIRDGGEAGAHLGYSAPLTEIVLLGTMAQRTGKRIYWNPEKMTAEGVTLEDVILKPRIDREWIPS
jgi:predicted dehydrogenase